MSQLINYKTVQIVDPDPAGEGGLALNSNFKALVDTKASRPNTKRLTYLTYGQVYDSYSATMTPTLLGVGDTPAAAGTVALVAPDATEGATISYSTSATTNAAAGVYGGTLYRTGRNVLFQAYAKLNATASQRVFVGLTTNTYSVMVGADNPAGHYAGFQYSTARGDANWKCVTKDGTTQGTPIDSAIAVDTAGRRFEVELDDVAAKVYFRIDGTLVGTATANLPGSGQNLRFACAVATLQAVAKVARVGWVYLESDK